MNDKYINNSESIDYWFNFTKWHTDDIAEILVENNIEPSNKNINIFFEELYDQARSLIIQQTNELLSELISQKKELFIETKQTN